MNTKQVIELIGKKNWRFFNLFMMNRYVSSKNGRMQFDDRDVEEYCEKYIKGELDADNNRGNGQNRKIDVV